MQKNEKLAGADLLASLALIALGAWMFLEAKGMKVFRTLIISPGLFPLIIGGIFVLCGGILFIMAMKRGGFRDMLRVLSVGNMASVFGSPTFKRGSIILGMIVAYVALFGNPYLPKLQPIVEIGGKVVPININFIFITFAYLFCTFIYLKAMSVAGSFIVSLGAAVIVFFAFNQGFGIPIP